MPRPLFLPASRDEQAALSDPYIRRSWAARLLIRTAGVLLDTARWLLGARP